MKMETKIKIFLLVYLFFTSFLMYLFFLSHINLKNFLIMY